MVCAVVFCVFLAALPSCAAPAQRGLSPGGDPPRDVHANAADDAAANRDLNIARGMIRAGEYSLAIPRLENIIAKHPGAKSARAAHYHLGVCYQMISDFREAHSHFTRYLELQPGGEHEASAREYLAGMSDFAGGEALSPEEAAARLSAMEAAAETAPTQLAPQLELANAYWARRDFDKAGAIYRKILLRWPQLEQDTIIRQRMTRAQDGTWTVLTPKVVIERSIEADPLVIFNTASFRGGRLNRRAAGLSETEYNVTGEVLNRSSGPLTSVQIFVTIYGFGSMVYDTQTISFGRLRPGERRAFSAKFTNFDTIDNVRRFEVTGTYER